MRSAFLSLLLWAQVASARCPDGVYLFPGPGSVIATNTRFILEGVGARKEKVGALAGRGDVVLKSKEEAVSVRVSAGWKSSRGRVAVLLRPSRELKPNTTYRLEPPAGIHESDVLNVVKGDRLSWTTGTGRDTVSPKYELKPSIAEGMYSGEGDRISSFVKLHTSLVEEGPALLDVTIRRARNATGEQKYFVLLNGGEGLLGHDACNGAYDLDDGRAYKAVIRVIDAAGNEGQAKDNSGPMTLEFHAPKRVR